MSDSKDIEFDVEKIDEATLGLLWLTSFRERKHDELLHAWKGYDFDALERLFQKGLIYEPVGKRKAISFTPRGEKLSEEICHKLFAKD